MNRNTLIGIALAAMVLIGGLVWYAQRDDSTPAGNVGTVDNGGAPKGETILPIVGKQAEAGMIVIDAPKVGDRIGSPVEVSGRARGGWYSEASAQVMIIDTNGVVLGRGTVTAQGEWMTEELVPFTGSIEWSGKTADQGAVVFLNDNPSGLDENARFYAIPVFLR